MRLSTPDLPSESIDLALSPQDESASSWDDLGQTHPNIRDFLTRHALEIEPIDLARRSQLISFALDALTVIERSHEIAFLETSLVTV